MTLWVAFGLGVITGIVLVGLFLLIVAGFIKDTTTPGVGKTIGW